jgi:hypothetical protein
MRFFGNGAPRPDIVSWVLQSALLDQRRYEGMPVLLSTQESRGFLTLERRTVSLAYARCMVAILPFAVIGGLVIASARQTRLVPLHAILVTFGSAVVMAVVMAPALAQVVILAWFTSRRGDRNRRVLHTTPEGLKRASIGSWLAAVAGGVAVAVFA